MPTPRRRDDPGLFSTGVAGDSHHPERAAVAALSDSFVAGLREWIKIPSIGVAPEHRVDVQRSAEWLAGQLREDGWPEIQIWDHGPALPAVYACWPAEDPGAPTVLVYGHHDVQPVDPVERWHHPPFEPVTSGDELYGRGASDDKGQVAMHLLALKAHLAATGQNAPSVTLKLFVEGEEESGSPHLRKLLEAHAEDLACDLVVFTDTALHDRDAPTVNTGQRGVLGGEITFFGGTDDVHSGRAGGAIPNPATALARLIAALHDENGRITLPGFYDDVREPSDSEREDYAELPFDEQKWLAHNGGGAQALAGEPGYTTLERIWVRPTAEINGLSSGYTGPGLKTIIPATATAKLSFRLVPDQLPEKVADGLREFVAKHTPAGVRAEISFRGEGVPPYAISPDDPANATVKEAMELAFDQPVRFARAGGSGPAAVLQAWLGVPLVYLGATLPDDRVHAPNERVVVPLLLKGAEAAAHLWRMLPERLSR